MNPNNAKCAHMFASQEVGCMFRKILLEWYDNNKRELQWRQLAKHADPNIRGYSVLVSEIMLQQTQVATVKSYYCEWMKKWPTLEALSKASLQEVHAMWAGLGYYSRGKRLHETAGKIVNEMDGSMPQDAKELKTKLPGVGPYTAAAVASIAFNHPVGLVDGNVIRVFSRVFSIGADTTQKHVIGKMWELADEAVDRERPGDFNQALMELGALICTPKQANCNECPVSSYCRAHQRTLKGRGDATVASIGDIEDDPNCDLCLSPEEPWIAKDGVMNYPRKRKKASPKQARNAVVVVENAGVSECVNEDKSFLLWQRPKEGLLASLWEFPSFTIENLKTTKAQELSFVRNKLANLINAATVKQLVYVGEVFHQFSHISQTYALYHAVISSKTNDYDVRCMRLPDNYQDIAWMNQSEINTSAISTAMKKVFQFFNQSPSETATTSSKRKRTSRDDSQQRAKKKANS